MTFTTFEFLGFLCIVLTVFYLMPKTIKKYWLLLSSYYFYASADASMLLALILITALTYVGGMCIEKYEKRSKLLFGIFFATNIGILFLYKYTPFVVQNTLRISNHFGMGLSIELPKFLIPLGLSFFVFQSTTYLGDVYRKKIKTVRVSDYALFVAFFPTLLSGPIQKARYLLPQFSFDKKFELEWLKKGLLLLVYGFMVKFFLADALGNVVDIVFDDYLSYHGFYYVIAAVCYSLQIYADFLSYSEMARGVSLLFGIEVTRNFKNPYLSTSLSEFWRNWHMSLNEWFLEYIYIPLGGSKKGKWRTYINKMIVFLCSGLWHGASWHFVAWGGVNGLLQIVGECTREWRQKLKKRLGVREQSIVLLWFRRTIVFCLISVTWIFFRMPSVSAAVHVIRNICNLNMVQIFDVELWSVFGTTNTLVMLLAAIVVFANLQMSRWEGKNIYKIFCEEPKLVKIFVIAICIMIVFICMCEALAQPDKSFIYFQF